jgi:hypothetical protein
MGQWSQGGMITIGDMFNQGLKHRVDSLCREIANLLRCRPSLNQPDASHSQSQGRSGRYDGVSLFIPGSGRSSSNWWPAELGSPASTGAQNNLQYACFPVSRRLAIPQGQNRWVVLQRSSWLRERHSMRRECLTPTFLHALPVTVQRVKVTGHFPGWPVSSMTIFFASW